ncbi:hypothetical protein NDU88_002947 [Pleurodeles waltl]|uniref:Uncharacterized protein n=1 Tax=Pleurodeles waltl TaxID=8319 RepID=A0AAV7LLL6_PLEWA|nr:hypothetical protein NDU88_002947 [Pleurodeles waltl]
MSAGWFFFCRETGAGGLLVLWRGLLSTSGSSGGGLFIGLAIVKSPVLCHYLPHSVGHVCQHPCNGDQGGVDVLQVLPDPKVLSLLQPHILLQRVQYLAQCILGMLVWSQDRGECLLERQFPGPVLPLSHSSLPSFPVVLCLCPLNRVPTATDPRSLIVLCLWGGLGSL